MNKNIGKKYRGLLLLLLVAGGLMSEAAGGTADTGYPETAVVTEQDTAAMLYELGVSRMNGEGTEQAVAQGRYWIHLAARHGYPLAQYNLGVMYFDGIGGGYSRQCAQWWLNRAAGQNDPEVRQMAGQALQSIEPEMMQLPKVYRPVTARECDRLPEWSAEVRAVTGIPALPEGDIDTGRMVIAAEELAPVPDTVAEAPVSDEAQAARDTAVTESESGGAVSQDAAENTADVVAGGEAVSPADTAAVQGNRVTETGETDTGHLPAPVVRGDAGKAGTAEITGTTVSGSDRDDTGITPADTQMITPSADGESAGDTGKDNTGESVPGTQPVSGGDKKGSDMPDDTVPAKPKVLKPREVRPAPVLNLGGSPATAPGKHYTLQLSGGTTPDELYRKARRHKLTNYVVYETARHGQRWYVLVAGEYATLTAANQALKTLPAELRRNGPWVRSLGQVQRELHQ